MSKAYKLRLALAELNSPSRGLTNAINIANEALRDALPIVELAERDREDWHNFLRAALLEDNAPDLIARLTQYVISNRTKVAG